MARTHGGLTAPGGGAGPNGAPHMCVRALRMPGQPPPVWGRSPGGRSRLHPRGWQAAPTAQARPRPQRSTASPSTPRAQLLFQTRLDWFGRCPHTCAGVDAEGSSLRRTLWGSQTFLDWFILYTPFILFVIHAAARTLPYEGLPTGASWRGGVRRSKTWAGRVTKPLIGKPSYY